MDSDDYFPRVMEDDASPEIPIPSDASKWAAVHDTRENATFINFGSKSGPGSLFTVAWVLGLTLGLIWVWRNGRTVFGQWQENLHRRTNRRRHGIPDDDDRPFNVAYAAVTRKQHQGNTVKPKVSKLDSLQSSQLGGYDVSIGLRQRPLNADVGSSQRLQPTVVQADSATLVSHWDDVVSQASAQSTSQPPALEPYEWSDGYVSNRAHDLDQTYAQPDVPGLQSGSTSAKANGEGLSDGNEAGPLLPERRKYQDINDDEDDAEDRSSKRIRVEGEELIDGDNDAPWIPGDLHRPSLEILKRGSKRHANPEDEGDWEMSQDKRARKGSLALPESDAMDDGVIMVDESPDAVTQTTRGTKREREVESVADDAAAENPDELHRPQPSRKRRDNGRRSVDERSPRGRKRNRSPEQHASSEEGNGNDSRTMRHKRGRRHEESEEDAEMVSASSSESDDMPSFVEDPACGGRRIGEVWEVNGQSFKVGLDGRRLRHALIKQQRSKFPMPRDSAHNDARTNVDVVIEKWLNDDEYKEAKDRFELAWQDPSPASTPLKAEATWEDDHSSAGKRLLWKGPAPTPVKGRASISSSSNIQNPFDLAPSNTNRRVSSAHPLMGSPGEGLKLRPSSSFSKWEKQDMEANSLKKMRARLEKEKEQEREKEKEAEKAKSCVPPAPAPTPLAPTTNKPTEDKKSAPTSASATTPRQGKTTPSAVPPLFAKPASDTPAGSIPNFFAKPSTTSTTANTATAIQPSTTSLFPAPTQSASSLPAATAPEATKPSFPFGPTPTQSAPVPPENKGAASKPAFSFGPTFGTPSPATPSSSAPATSSTPATSSGSKSAFSFATPPAQKATSDALKPPAFSFATPPPGFTAPSEQGKAAAPNPFAKPASQTTTTPSFAPTGSSPFTFNQSSQPSQPSQTKTQNPPTFQSGTPSNPANIQNNSGTSSGAGTSSGSLLNRLGPVASSSQPSQTTTPSQNAWPSPFGGALASSTTTPATNPPSTNIFGQTKSQPQQDSSTPSESPNKPSPFGSTSSGPSKNVFGQSSFTATPSPFLFATPPGASDKSKAAAPSVFGMPSGQPPAPSVFGTPGGQSGVSSTSQPAASVFGKPSGPADAPGAQSRALSVFGKPSGQSDGSATQSTSLPAFGKPSGQSNASATQSTSLPVFGKPSGQADASTSQPGTLSVFGKPSGQSDAGQSDVSGSQAGALSAFGTPGGQSGAVASQPKAAFSFAFGNATAPTSSPSPNPFQPQASSQAPATGGTQPNPAQPNNFFGFGQSSSTTSSTPGTNAFGFANKPAEADKK